LRRTKMYKRKLVFATNNPNKLSEAEHILSSEVQLLTLQDIGWQFELPETHETIEENAIEKAEFLYNRFKANCFSDDTGLEVEALNGAPGVYSARFAGPGKSYQENNTLLLEKMKAITNRKARFKTVVVLILEGEKYLFEGIVKGIILEKPIGEQGFGYDPVFQPEGFSKSFAQMSLEEKNKISHRKIALKKLADFLVNKPAID
jgi:XTP/dITP diphosphohydrolase